MAYEFFFSYARANDDAYLKQFFNDLSEDIRQKRGLPRGAEVGFLDQAGLDLGTEWDPAIVAALQDSNVLLAVASPAYFKSDYCGKEWALFRRRCEAAAGPGGQLPPLLKSIVWIKYPIEPLPHEVRSTQLLFADPQALHNEKGFRYLLRQLAVQQTLYNDLIDQLGTEIIEAGDTHRIPPLPPAQVPALAQVRSAFEAAAAEVAPARPGGGITGGGASGPRHVHFIFVAANPQDFGPAFAADAYLEAGAGDWKPFFPDDVRPINPLLAQVAARDDLLFSSTEVPFGPDLIERVDAAWKQRQIVVIVIDPWSVHWDAQRHQPSYQALLRQLDARLDYHWCVLVPWNERSEPLSTQRDQVVATVLHTFDRHATLAPNPMFYRDGIRSAQELQSAVAEVLTRLKEEIKKRAPVERPVPAGPARLVVSGPSARS
ncbi:toll/interleukin-1 receptor domain-containing protein [Azohydromonas aeria]|uniref:toll/interleukin-1 receptor domain-containing protein n=1 Tax=Azohydromonas aeria TaxID=2590212 RepID=UPI0012F7E1ED|nr:toll/interleukin-1 receptor domain-containing protein [Azohydromonas aeria]